VSFCFSPAGGFSVTFFIAKKVTKKSSRSINSPFYTAHVWLSGMLSRLVRFQVLFLEDDYCPFVLMVPETNRSGSSDNMERQGFANRIDLLLDCSDSFSAHDLAHRNEIEIMCSDSI
jgi:hypothetical protein